MNGNMWSILALAILLLSFGCVSSLVSESLSTSTTEGLIQKLQSPDMNQRYHAAEALGNMALHGENISAAYPYLAQIMTDPQEDFFVRSAATRAMKAAAARDDISEYIPIIVNQTIFSGNSDVRAIGLQALEYSEWKRVEYSDIEPPITAALNQNKSDLFQRRALNILNIAVSKGVDITPIAPTVEAMAYGEYNPTEVGQDTVRIKATIALTSYYVYKQDWEGLDELAVEGDLVIKNGIATSLRNQPYGTELYPTIPTLRRINSSSNARYLLDSIGYGLKRKVEGGEDVSYAVPYLVGSLEDESVASAYEILEMYIELASPEELSELREELIQVDSEEAEKLIEKIDTKLSG